MTAIDLTITPQRSALLAGHDNECLALVRVTAPGNPAADARRTPLNLAIVIDRSGSMSGKPLEEAKRCAGFIIERLEPTDRAAIVVYDDKVDTLVAAQPVIDRGTFHGALAAVESRGCTALFDGWQQGARQAALAAGGEHLSRVLLLSDGCANRGPSEPEAITPHCREMETAGVSTSTYGLGHHFNEELMVAMARAGHGQSYYGESAEDLIDPFTEEFDLLRALCARKLRLKLETPAGVTVRVLNDYLSTGEGTWALPDLAFGGEVWALVRLRVPAALCTPGAAVTELVRARVVYEDLATATQASSAASLSLGAVPAAAFEAIAEDERVVARARELRAAELQLEAREAARRGDWQRVDAILARAAEEARDNPWVEQALAALRRYAEQRRTEEFSKEAMYSSRRMSTRMAAPDESVRAYAASAQMDIPAFLRRKVQQGKRLDKDAPK